MGQAYSQLKKRRKATNDNVKKQPVTRNIIASLSNGRLPRREDRRNDHPFFNSGQEFFAHHAIPILVSLHSSNDASLDCINGDPEYIRLTVDIWDFGDEQQKRFWNGAVAEIKVLISRGVISSKSVVQHGGLFTRVWEYQERAKKAIHDFLEDKNSANVSTSGSTTPRAAPVAHETSSLYSREDNEDKRDAAVAQLYIAQSSSMAPLHSDLPEPKEYELLVRNMSPLTLTPSLDSQTSQTESEAPIVLHQTASMQHLKSMKAKLMTI